MNSLPALAALLALAIATDLRSRRIPNRLVLVGIVVAFAWHAAARPLHLSTLAGPAWYAPLAGLAAGFALFLPLHLLRAMGAGDVKLMAMVGAFLGPSAVVTAVLYTLMAGGLLSMAWMLVRGVAAQTLCNLRVMLTDWTMRAGLGHAARIAPLEATAARLPYALAIATGTLASIAWPMGALL